MKKYSNKTKKSSRRPARLKTLKNRDDHELDTVPETSVKNARIKSAIENGNESLLPSDTTTGHCLKKFEHNGKEGPLVVYAEDRKMFNEYGHFTVITSFKPSDSLRNQLFFGTRSSLPGIVSTNGDEISQTAAGVNYLQVNNRDNKNVHQKNNSDGTKQRLRQPSSFEGLVVRYKNRQEKYKRLLGEDAMYLFQKIDHLCNTKDNPKKETQIEKQDIKSVLPKIKVDKTDDEPMIVNDSNTLDRVQPSRRTQEPHLPHLTVSRYSTV